MSIAVYRSLWGMTQHSKARSRYGWYHVYRRILPWAIPTVPALFWWTFLAWDEEYKKLITLGFYKRELYFWDARRSGGDTGWYA